MVRKHYSGCKVRKHHKKGYPCSISLVLYRERWRPTSWSLAPCEGHPTRCALLRVGLQRSRVGRVLITALPKSLRPWPYHQLLITPSLPGIESHFLICQHSSICSHFLTQILSNDLGFGGRRGGYMLLKGRQNSAPAKPDHFCKTEEQWDVLFCQQIWEVSNPWDRIRCSQNIVSDCTINELLFNISFSPYCSRHGTKALVMVPFKPCGGDRITNICNTHHCSITNAHLFINFKCPVWFFSEALALYSTLLDRGTTYVDFCCKHKHQHLKSGI